MYVCGVWTWDSLPHRKPESLLGIMMPSQADDGDGDDDDEEEEDGDDDDDDDEQHVQDLNSSDQCIN